MDSPSQFAFNPQDVGRYTDLNVSLGSLASDHGDETYRQVVDDLRRAHAALARGVVQRSAVGATAPDAARAPVTQTMTEEAGISVHSDDEAPSPSAAVDSPLARSPALSVFSVHRDTKVERDLLIARLLAERRSRLGLPSEPFDVSSSRSPFDDMLGSHSESHVSMSRPVAAVSTVATSAPPPPAPSRARPPELPSPAREARPSRIPLPSGSRPRREDGAVPSDSAPARGQRYVRPSIEALRREAEVKEREACTFHPEVNRRPRSSRAEAPMPREARLALLAQPKQVTYEERERKRREEEEARFQRECTFKPELVTVSRQREAQVEERKEDAATGGIDGRGGAAAAREEQRARHVKPVTERLFREAAKRSDEREKQKRELEEEELHSYPFRPSVNPDNNDVLDMSQYRPIHKRVGDIQKARLENLHRLRMQVERENPDLTFKPQLSDASEKNARWRISLPPDARPGVVTRLTADARAALERRDEQEKIKEQLELEGCTFRPQLSSVSEALLREKKGQEVVWERLSKPVAPSGDSAADKECTFRPQVNPSTSRPTRSVEVLVNELSDRRRRDSEREHMCEEYYSQFTFKPTIHKRSHDLAGHRSLEQLHSDKETQRKHQAAAARAEEELMRQCTFRPSLEASRGPRPTQGQSRAFSLGVSNPDTIVDRIKEWQESKEAKLEEARRELEYEMLRDCTFRPAIVGESSVPADGPVIVRGLGRFLEQKELAKRLDAERQQRAEEAFQVKGVTGKERPRATVPQPFHLHTAARERSRPCEGELAAMREMEECTFHPHTTEAENRELIRAMIDQDSATA